MPIVSSANNFSSSNLMCHAGHPDWVIERWPFTDAGSETIGVMKPGYLVKFDTNRTAVVPALAADDATLEGIIIDLPDAEDSSDTVAIAVQGSFNQYQIRYADAHADTGDPTPLSKAALSRLRDMGIFLEPVTPLTPAGEAGRRAYAALEAAELAAGIANQA